jgi:hypothetical protein
MNRISAAAFFISFLCAWKARDMIKRRGGDIESFMANAPLPEFIMLQFQVFTMLMMQLLGTCASYLPRLP